MFDVSGWDVGKALRLTLKGNPTMLEWLRSPVVYSGDTAVRDALLAVAGRVLDRGAVGRHHLHVARLHLERSGTSLKRFLYALRPAATLRWLEVHPGSALPPMDLPTLLAEGDVPDDVRAAAAELVALKAVTRETGNGAVPEVLDSFVRRQLERAAHFDTMAPKLDRTAARRLADGTFRALLV